MAKSTISFFEIERFAIGPGSPALQGWSRVTREIVNSPLYRVAADIATRAGIAEGLIFAPAHEDTRGEIPTDRSLMSVTQAATALGVSRAAVHKAIQQKRLPARWYGNIVLVSREAVFRYAVTLGEELFVRDREARARFRERTWNEYLDFAPLLRGGTARSGASRPTRLTPPHPWCLGTTCAALNFRTPDMGVRIYASPGA